jgi:sirohydrochlorin cobaltochelatase
VSRALVIAAHGSHVDARTALPAWACADTIRQTGLFSEVTAAFWKGQPAFGTVLESLSASEITIVPFLTSQGFFSESVLPAELNPRIDQTTIITPGLGFSDHAAAIVTDRIKRALAGRDPRQTAIIIVGHGTDKHESSGSTTEHQVALLGDQFGSVASAYLDQEPFIHDIYDTLEFETVVIVPFFIAEGMHTQRDIPAALGLRDPLYQPQRVWDYEVIYTPPVGLDDALYQVVLALAGENPDAPLDPTCIWDHIPTQMLNRTIGKSPWGEVALNGSWLCHVADITRPRSELLLLETPAAIRAHLRFTDRGEFRPIPSLRDLPGGWIVPVESDSQLLAALETIYPNSGVIGFARSYQQVGARQQGKYQPIETLPPDTAAEIVHTLCAGCVRIPLWHRDGDGLPCLEPCSLWLDEGLARL